MADFQYQRLTRARMPQQFSIVVRQPRVSLWLGSDDLLLVEHRGFTETCKRFYFRDIQVISVRETSRRTIWNAVLTIPLAIFLGLSASTISRHEYSITITWSIFAAIFLVPFLINNLRGKACVCELRTAVQTENLGSLSRLPQTRKVFEKIHPLITAAQGQLTADEVSARMRGTAVETTALPQPDPPAAPPVLS